MSTGYQSFISKSPQDIGWVYLLKTSDGSYSKIGSGVDLRRRYRQVKLQLPFSVELEAAFSCLGFRSVERYLHTELAHLRLNGEWFKYDMPIIIPAFLEVANTYSSPGDTYFLDEGEGWISLENYDSRHPIMGWSL